jgi:hypothetical protein
MAKPSDCHGEVRERLVGAAVPAGLLSVHEARLAALVALSESPDLCRWQYEATHRGEHVSVYCILTDAARHLELALTDDRFDDHDPIAVDSSSDLLYLYDSVLFRSEQLLRDLYQLATSSRMSGAPEPRGRCSGT